MRKLLVFILLMMVIISSAWANNLSCVALKNDDPSIPAKPITIMLDMNFQMSGVPGLIVGIVYKNKTQLFSCGEVAKNSGLRPTGDTVWQIGSLSKVITTAIFSMMIQEKKVSLMDNLSNYVPPPVIVPTFKGKPITLLDLATYTAGLPLEIVHIKDPTKYHPNEPFDASRAYQWLSQYKLTKAPGTHYQYSNIGFGLLGNALAYKEKISYSELVDKYINKRLNMIDTTTTLDESQQIREATSYWMSGKIFKPDESFNFDQPSGGIYSTANDLLKFIKYNLNITTKKYERANHIAHKTHINRHQLDNGITFASSGLALGWEVDNEYNGLPMILTKNGWASGFTSWMILAPSENIGVFSISTKPYLPIKGSLLMLMRTVLSSNKKSK
ncbi:serine hydrolase [Thiotrichales bacterium 19S3-7]|nr:serine hydrolase [Thiotrichales bacterium 19S3-7]MCF6800751.1 serine hydrolase [Thiotrichales bacterium 19S3-11]